MDPTFLFDEKLMTSFKIEEYPKAYWYRYYFDPGEDKNDHAPVFPNSHYRIDVSESVEPGTPILTVAAKDKDAGVNAEIRYELIGGASDMFSVNSNSGLIRTREKLDREKNSNFYLLILALDSSLTEPKSATTKVLIAITDENDNSPRFPKDEYTVYIPFPTKTGDFVFGDPALDPDEGRNGKIIYHLSGDDAAKFDLDQWKGIIKASAELEEDRVYDIIVGAQDFGAPPLSSSTRLRIHLRPFNLFPTFESIEKTFSFSENEKGVLVTKVRATSPKNGYAGSIKYRIAGGNVNDAFEINEDTGNVVISSKGIDFETLKQYELYISAIDHDNPPLASTVYLVVNVSDYNDNSPEFTQSLYNSSLMEDLPPPQLIGIVSATDKDSGINAKLAYRLKENDEINKIFSLDNETGKIYTKVRLKREEIDRYEFTVEAVDKGSPSQTGTAMVVVNVEDKNNNPPRFTRLFSVNVTENAEIGTFVIQVTSSDRDIGENANVTYSFTENPSNKFHIDPISGNVTVIAPIDREVKDEYSLKVSASDGSWKAETPLTITVQDENDNAPSFDSNFYEFNFPELQRSVAFVGQVRAHDRDKQGPNSAISFSLKFPSDFFSVDSISGEILSKQVLKYRHTLKGPSPENQYHLTVVATDNGKPPMSSEASILINVVDANNNQPQFKKKRYLSPVPENSKIGQKIIELTAVDDVDYGINAQIVYEKIGGNGTDYFSLETNTGWIKVAKDLRGKTGVHYVLLVRARDKGVPPLHDEVLVTLVITGENKHSPKFTASSYQVIIAENEKLGSTIGTVRALDDDIGPNGIVQYAITSGNEVGKFSISENSGAVSILSPLDYDTVKEYRLNITAHDLAFEPQYATAVLTVLLTDVNDNPPRFDKDEYKAYIPENSEIGTTVFQLNASDIDSAQNAVIQFSVVGGDGKMYFSINSKTGLIKSRKIFDYEQKNKYTLNVVASNPDSKQRSSAKVIIFISGKNEYFPKFIQPVFQFTVSESALIGTSVGTIQASDDDLGDDGVVYYLLVGSSNDRGFHIQPSTGVLSVARNLDRESQNRVVLTVMAKNAGSIRGNDTDEAQIIISIQDGNDPPVFEKPFYKTRLSEGALIGTKVYTVNAVDSDIRPQNNQFTYTIIGGNHGQVFKVDPQTGVIETTAQLDRETIEVYNLTIGAIDNGSPSQTGTTLVQVILEDINDNGPQFDPPEIIGYAAENEPAMTSVMTLSATDPDLPPNTKPFTYYIIGGEHKDFFSVDENTGEVKTTRNIDRETTPELTFRIEVHDSGKPRMKSEFPVTIIILDKNDSPSTPRTATVKVMTLHGTFPGGKVADVHPNDADTSGQYSCEIIRTDSSIFSIPNACNMHASRGNHDHSYSLSISGNDGRYANVTSKIHVEFESFDNTSLENSLIIRVINVTSARFLRLYYKSFMESISRLFNNEVIHVFSLSAVDTHTDITIAAESLSSDNFLKPTDVTDVLKRREDSVTKALQGLQYIVNYNPCDGKPCENDGVCSNKINAYEETEITDSPSLILTTPIIKNDIACSCQQGFAGEFCQLRQDPCSPNPCQFGGTCSRRGFNFVCTCPPSRQGSQCEVDKTNACDNNPCRNGGSCQTTLEGGFFCLCRPGFRGNQCELESESCRPNPCQNGGSCISLRPGYKCSCPLNFYGPHCEKSTFSFSELSFMTFPTLDSTTNDISIIFSTNKPDALLVYNYGLQTGGRSDFVAIEITGGKPRFSYGGSRTEITYVTVDKQVTDGDWYKVTATRNGRVISLSVSECSNSGEICKECRPVDPNCYADAIGLTGTLNFNNEPMYFGGVMTVDPIQERPNQVYADDFVGCIQSASINGRPLNLSGPIQQRGISNTCKRIPSICKGNPCGEGAQCLDRWSTYKCLCPNGLLAPDCGPSLKPVTFSGESFVEYQITEQHRRKQLLPQLYQKHSRWVRQVVDYSIRDRRQLSSLPPKNLSLQFRTLESNGILLHSATNNDYTMIQVLDGKIIYSSKLGANKPMNMTLRDKTINDGIWHNLSLVSSERSLRILLDDEYVGEELEISSVHDFLDAYLTSITIGNAPHFSPVHSQEVKGFIGCMTALSVDGEIQPFNSTESNFLQAVPHNVKFIPDCSAWIGSSASTDPISIGITLVIVFFVLLLIAIFISFIVYRVRQQKKEKDGGHVFQNGSALLANTSSDSGRTPQDSGYVESAEMTDDVLRSHLSQELAAKKYKEREHERPQRPDIIEREVINKSPGVPLRVEDNPHGDRDNMVGLGHIQEGEQPEHYDLENASSIAPSDIDIVYHYKGYRDGNVRKYKTNPHVPGYHKHNHRHSPHNFPNTPHRESPRNIIRQSPNPVAPRESPTTPRILTLQDLSGKPLQTALLATSQGPGVKDVMSNSERSLNSPVSHLSQSSGSIHASSQSTKKKKHENSVGLGLSPDEIDRLNSRPRNSSLLTTLDAVSSSSEDHQRKEKLAELLETNTELLEAPDSSTDESGNDSFTCSEFEYDNNYEKVTRDFGPGTMIFSKLAEVDNENEHDIESSKNYDGFDSFRGSLSTLVASDDDLSNMSSYKPPNGSILGWDNLLNWGPDYESFVGCQKQILYFVHRMYL
ncbi:Cadherin-related tumor suppressor [Armadillidium vulgare]|nr:Cadherin-related tumor suppressor [Armadillidium vulgare]